VAREKAAVLNALMIKDIDSDDLLDFVEETYGIKDTEAAGVATDVLVKGNYLVMKGTVLHYEPRGADNLPIHYNE
jgi:hypothetical protein